MYVGSYALQCLTDLAQIELRQQALKALLRRCRKRLQESLNQRIERAKEQGSDPSLTRTEWMHLHEKELVKWRGRATDLELAMAHSREQGMDLKRAMARAKRIRSLERSKSGGTKGRHR